LNNLEKDLGMSGVQFNTTVSMSVVPQFEEHVLTPLQPVRGLCAHANSLEYVDYTHQAWNLHEWLDVDLGGGVCLHSASTELWRFSRMPLLSGYHGSKFMLETLSL
jgi:hypothetical protein